MSEQPIELLSGSEEETQTIGARLAGWLREGDVVLLHGDLGAGKTTLVKGIAAGLRVNGVVSSPSFALVNEYEAGLAAPVTRLYHLDLYRLHSEEDLATIGFADLTAPADGIAVVEWPERAGKSLPNQYLLVELDHAGTQQRAIRVTAQPDAASWQGRLEDLARRLTDAPVGQVPQGQ